jgi:serine/threonine protein kinase
MRELLFGVRACAVAAQGVLKCLTLNRITFTRLLGPLQERLALEMDRRELQMGTIKFADLEPIKLIGSGSFAFVRLVLHRPSNVTYALKTMYRGSIIKLNQVEHILSEAKILKRCAHPFLPRLAATYKDADALYILMDFVPGGELFSVLRAQHRFLEPVAAFYAASARRAAPVSPPWPDPPSLSRTGHCRPALPSPSSPVCGPSIGTSYHRAQRRSRRTHLCRSCVSSACARSRGALLRVPA